MGIEISKFTQAVQQFISDNKIDDGDGIIKGNKKTGELAALLSGTGASNVEELMMDSFKITTPTRANATKQTSSSNLQEDFRKAGSSYLKMNEEQQKDVQLKYMDKAENNYRNLELAFEKLYTNDIPNSTLEEIIAIVDDIHSNSDNLTPEKIANIILGQMFEKLEPKLAERMDMIDNEFGDYDEEYETAFPNVVHEGADSDERQIIADFKNACLSKALDFIKDGKSGIEVATRLLASVIDEYQNASTEIAKVLNDKLEMYRELKDQSLDNLIENKIIQMEKPLGVHYDPSDYEMPEIYGAPMQRAFVDTMDEYSLETGINNTTIENKNDKPIKVLVDGKIQIVKGDNIYNLDGTF